MTLTWCCAGDVLLRLELVQCRRCAGALNPCFIDLHASGLKPELCATKISMRIRLALGEAPTRLLYTIDPNASEAMGPINGKGFKLKADYACPGCEYFQVGMLSLGNLGYEL